MPKLKELRKAHSEKEFGPKLGRQTQRWSHLAGQNGGLAKVDSGFDYAANFSSFACVA